MTDSVESGVKHHSNSQTIVRQPFVLGAVQLRKNVNETLGLYLGDYQNEYLDAIIRLCKTASQLENRSALLISP